MDCQTHQRNLSYLTLTLTNNTCDKQTLMTRFSREHAQSTASKVWKGITMADTQPTIDTMSCKNETEQQTQQQDHIIRQPTPIRPVSQPSLQGWQPQLPLQWQTRSQGPTEIGFPFWHAQPPDIYRRRTAPPTQVANAVNSFIPINLIQETAYNREVASITNSSRSHHQGFTTSTGTTPGDSSRSGFHSEHSAFGVYLRDSRWNPVNCTFLMDQDRLSHRE